MYTIAKYDTPFRRHYNIFYTNQYLINIITL